MRRRWAWCSPASTPARPAFGAAIDLLLAHGARLDLRAPDVLHRSLANHATRAAEQLIELGAEADVCAAAALGAWIGCAASSTPTGKLTAPVRRGTETLSARDADRAGAAVRLRERAARCGRLPAREGRQLEHDRRQQRHRAPPRGRQRRSHDGRAAGREGRRIDDRNNPFNATPLSWADHEGKSEVFHWMRTHCPVDIHDAVCFGLIDHVRARIAERPELRATMRSINGRFPRATPLHFAAHMRRAGDRGAAAGRGRAPQYAGGRRAHRAGHRGARGGDRGREAPGGEGSVRARIEFSGPPPSEDGGLSSVSRESNATVAACGSTGTAGLVRARCDSTRLTPPITATAATTRRALTVSPSSATAPPAAITGTLSCSTAAWRRGRAAQRAIPDRVAEPGGDAARDHREQQAAAAARARRRRATRSGTSPRAAPR